MGVPLTDTETVRFVVGDFTSKRRLKVSHLYTEMLPRDGFETVIIGGLFLLASSSRLGSAGSVGVSVVSV